MFRNKLQNGFSLIEILIAISFIGVAVLLIFDIGVFNNRVRKLNEERTQALFYASQAIETIKLLDWSIVTNGDHYLVQQGNTWVLASGSELIDGKYTRTISVADARRASTTGGQIYGPLDDNGLVDPDTKKITITLDWPSRVGGNKQEVLESYVYRWKADRWVQTDWVGGFGQANWSDSTKYFVKDAGVDVTVPGIITLLSGFLDWNNATTTATFDTPGNFDDNDVYELDGYAYLVTENNSSGSEFYILDVSDIYNPIQISSLDIGAGVTSVVVKDNYAYISTRKKDGELTVIDISNKNSPFIAARENLEDNNDAEDLVVDETELYIIQDEELYSFSIVNPTSPQQLDKIEVDDDAREIFLSADHLYVATEDSSKELQIIDVTNPSNIFLMSNYNLPGSLKGTDVNVQGNRAYISTQNNGGGKEFFIFDISDPENPLYIGDYEVGETVYSFAIVGPYALLGTNLLNDELTVIDVSFPNTINKVSGFALSGHILGMSADCATIYAATSSNQNEFFIISTQVANCGYTSSGTLESSTLDTGTDSVSYNWISWTATAPQNTTIRFQLASSSSINGPWSFVGPGGTSGSYYTTAAKEFINYSAHLNDRYIRYKLFLDSTASFQTPILEELTISYSSYP